MLKRINLPLIFCVFVVLAYLLSFNYKYAPITEFWFVEYANLINNGRLPYKDFYLLLPPLYPLVLAGLLKIFGFSYVLFRTFGLLICLAITLYYFKTLKYFTSSNALAAFAATPSIIYAFSGVAFFSYDFTQLIILNTVLCLYLIIKITNYENNVKDWLLLRDGFILGTIGSLGVLIKHSNSALIIVGTALCLLHFSYIKKNYIAFISFATSCLIVFGIFTGGLYYFNITEDFIYQVLVGASSAKGDPYSIFFGWTSVLISNSYLTCLFTLALVYFAWLIIAAFPASDKISLSIPSSSKSYSVIKVILFCFFVYLSFYSWEYISINFSINTTFIFLAILTISLFTFAFKIYRSNWNDHNNKYLYYFLMCISALIGNGTSAGVGEISLFLICGITVVILTKGSIGSYATGPIYLLLGSLVYGIVMGKQLTPYYWWGIRDDPLVFSNKYISNKSIFQHISMSENQIKIFDFIENNLNENHLIYSFPSIPLMYLLSGSKPATKAVVQWFDFLPNDLAIEEANSLEKKNFDYIVILDYPKDVWEFHRKLFRNGSNLGQESIINILNNKISNEGYFLEQKFNVGDGVNLEFWKNANVVLD